MGIHGHVGCGSKAGVSIELKTELDQCKTKPYGGFSAGNLLDWTVQQLGNCATAHFDPNKETISFWIKTNINDRFCPTFVKIILNDQKNTTYSISLPGDWHNIDDKHDVMYNATKL